METRRSYDNDRVEEVAALALDCFASPTWEAWDALVAAAEQRQVDLQKLLLSPTEEGRLLDGSRLVRSSLGYGEKREIGQGLELFMGPEGLSMYRMMTGCGEEVTQETLDARLAAAAEAMEARRAEEAPRAAAERASEHSTALSRFDTSMPAADATPLEGVAQWIVEARCEVRSDPASEEPLWGYRHQFRLNAMSLSGSALALAGCTGYKGSLAWASVLTSVRPPPPSSLAQHAASTIVQNASADELCSSVAVRMALSRARRRGRRSRSRPSSAAPSGSRAAAPSAAWASRQVPAPARSSRQRRQTATAARSCG
mmetsp:Transcript_26122/g.85492  ORF Transcript_26122/g.85492 Transcript_26122/m.85492 type:complete len:314 (+) Transcript_26122:1-942(+)